MTERRLAARMGRTTEAATIAMARRSQELRAQGMDVIALSLGEPDLPTPQFIKDAAQQAMKDEYTKYSPVPGYEDLRVAICEKLKRDNGLTYEPSEIVVSTGAKQALTNVVMALVDPGDEVLLLAPYWVSYKDMVILAEGVPVELYAGVEQGFKVTPDQLEAAITPKTRLVMVASPSNPTGAVYTRDELEALAVVLRRHPDVIVVVDEIYELIVFPGTEHTSLAALDGMWERCVTVNGVSKAWCMTGWRIGYTAAPKWISAACAKMQGLVTSATCSIAQRAALAAVLADPKKELSEAIGVYQRRRDVVIAGLKLIPGVRIETPPGAMYAFPDVSHYFGKCYVDKESGEKVTVRTSSDLAMFLLTEALVATVAGDAFGSASCIRITFSVAEDVLQVAVQRIADALASLQDV